MNTDFPNSMVTKKMGKSNKIENRNDVPRSLISAPVEAILLNINGVTEALMTRNDSDKLEARI